MVRLGPMTYRTPFRSFVRCCLVLVPLLAAACSGGQLVLPGDLRVGIQTDYPPLAFERDGEIVGVEPDLARKVGEALDRRVRFVKLERKDLISALEKGDVDVVMAGLSVTPAREQRIRFIEPYADVGQMAILRRDRVVELGRVEDLKAPGRHVGFVRGTTGGQYVKGVLSSSVPYPYGSVPEGLDAVRSGAIDYFVHDAPTAWRIGMDPTEKVLFAIYRPLTRERLAWAVRKDDTGLANQLDALVAAWKKNGEIDAVLTRWVPVRVTQ